MTERKLHEFSKFRFSIADYCVFLIMLVVSTGTGIYFGYFREKLVKSQTSLVHVQSKLKIDFGSKAMHDYLLGSRKLKIFPVAMSLVGSYISGVTMLGTPSEIYNHGTQYWLIIIPIIFMAVVVSKVYLPVFMVLHVSSSYQYLEMRFSSSVRSMASFMFVMDEMFFLPIVVYVPAIAFNQVSGLHIHIVSAVIVIICVVYTLVGGIKAVVHTDAWQILVMFVSLAIVVILGMINAGGPGPVFKSASEGGRLIFFNINPSLYERQSLWGVFIGGFIYWTAFNSVNQTMVQRYMSLSTLQKAEKSIIIFTIGILLFVSVCVFSGLLVFHFYRFCDPMCSGLISHDDQLLPIYVMQTVGHLHGIPGLFIAGVFGAALSSLSVVLNSTSLVFLQDVLRGTFNMKLTERATNIVVKGVIIVLGMVALSLVFVLEKLSGIFSVATAVTAIAAGTTFGIFTLGMLVPWSNTTGALWGAIAGGILSGWVSLGSQAAIAAKLVGNHKLPVSVEECLGNSTICEEVIDESDVFPLYRLSFYWVIVIGVSTTIFVGTVVSFITGPTQVHTLDAKLLSPVIHRFLPKECFAAQTESTGTAAAADNTATLLVDGQQQGKY